MNTAPVYLFADSEPLFKTKFSKDKIKNCRAAYIGFANKDQPEFYQLFRAVMQNNGIRNIHQITLAYSQEEKDFLSEADLILLAGGNVEFGINALLEREIDTIIARKYIEGSILIGVSAGAIHMGQCFIVGKEIKNCLKILPLNIDVHDETNDWSRLKNSVLKTSLVLSGIGITIHGGLIYHNDHSLEALYKPAYEFKKLNGNILTNLILPNNDEL